MKSFWPVLGFCFVVLSSLSPARAASGDAIAEQFRQRARLVPQYLYDRNYRTFGRLDLGRMLDQIDRAEITSAPSVVTRYDEDSLLTTERCLARWRLNGDRLSVVVGRDCYKRASARTVSVVGIHEFTGPGGINDEKYGPSSLLYLLYRGLQSGALDAQERADLVRRIELAANGGITAVGGGGDGAGVQGRIDFMERGLNRLQSAPPGSDERRKALAYIYGSSTYTNEQRRSGNCTKDRQIQSYPTEMAFAVNCLNIIEQYECQARDRSGKVNQKKFRASIESLVSVMKRDPQMEKLFPDADAFLGRCERAMSGGGL